MSKTGKTSAPPKEPLTGDRRPRIAKLAVRNFRAFPGDEEFVLDLGTEGKNLLLYGENGAGKSSLYVALQQLFAKGIYRPRYDYHDHLNIYTRERDGYVSASTTRSGMGPFRWEKNRMHPHVPDAISAKGRSLDGGAIQDRQAGLSAYQDFAKGVYLLDYKTLLRCSFPFDHEDRMDLADVLRLALYDHVVDGEPVSSHWHRLRMAQMKLHDDLNRGENEWSRELLLASQDLGSRAFTF